MKKEDSRYYVAWPSKGENCKLPKNYELNVEGPKSLQKQIKDDSELLQKYDEVIKDQLEKNTIVFVDEQNEQSDKPHHAIIKPENNTTKLLLVYDASAKTKKSNPSLNECLHRGPAI